MPNTAFNSAAALKARLAEHGYFCDEDLAYAAWLGLMLERPLLLEGDAGVGKTALAAELANSLSVPLIRLQCFEGLDHADAAYEWNYGRQLTTIRLSEARHESVSEGNIYTREFLLEKPLLKAISSDNGAVLLIDEIDRADEAFEAFLLEVLSEFQLSVPELGTIKAKRPPVVILTCNGTRELSDALRRRCLYHIVEYPDFMREVEIIRRHVPEADVQLISEAVQFVQALRKEELEKRPGVAESVDWVKALYFTDTKTLPDDPAALRHTLSCLLKTRQDQFYVSDDLVRKLSSGAYGA